MKNLVPLAFLIGGLLGALYCAAATVADPSIELGVAFGIACVIALIGWGEIRATASDVNESN